MLSSREILGPSGPLASRMDGYEDRQGQLAMADAVAAALSGGEFLLCEAGTGTGKTLAYLVPAILSRRKVVISTATKALQDQIVHKDLKLLHELTGLTPRVAVVKGLNNYLCLRRFTEAQRMGGLVADSRLTQIERWRQRTETGDRSELEDLAEADPTWGHVASSSDTRVGAGCEYFDRCFVTRMKREAEDADILVVNHHLLFADLAVKIAMGPAASARAGVLPVYDAVILDEAHQIEDIATEFFSESVSLRRIEALLNETQRLAEFERAESGSKLLDVARKGAQAFFETARVALQLENGERKLMDGTWPSELLTAYRDLDSDIEALLGWIGAREGDPWLSLDRRVAEFRARLSALEDAQKGDVRWAELGERTVTLGRTPVSVGEKLRAHFYSSVESLIMTSATLTTGGSSPYKFLRSRVGLTEPIHAPVTELIVASPFDFETNALLYTPEDLPEVTHEEFVPKAAERIRELVRVTGGGAFVLCTSNRRMREFASYLRRAAEVEVSMQGELPKGQLIERFRKSGRGVLVATMSFWEGVDVAGDALRLVIIDRLPFGVPTDPVAVARMRELETAGESAFLGYSVPEAAIMLKQGFGRLIRTRSDTGIVAVLDKRIQTRGYGKVLRASLPPAGHVSDLEDVRAWWTVKQRMRERGV